VSVLGVMKFSIKASALGRTLISGPVDPKRVIMNFMTPNTDTRTLMKMAGVNPRVGIRCHEIHDYSLWVYRTRN
jgi:hypothetical protein